MPTAAELARAIGATVEGDGAAPIGGIGLLETARPTDLAFIVSAALAPRALASKAVVVIAPPGAVLPGKTVLRHRAPKAAFAKAVAALVPERRPPAGVHPTAIVAPDAVLGANVSVGPHAVVESGARVGDGTVLHAGVVIRTGARVGRAGVLHPHVVCYPGVTLGDRVTVHAGSVIGSDGFGYVQEGTDAQPPPGEDLKDWRRYLLVDGPHVKVPQLGTVTIGDDVDIGAGCAIDRGTLGATVIGTGTKLDNLVHIAHNCVVGEHCLLTAGVCLAGSVKLGHHVVVGGQSGLGEGSSLGDFSLLAAHSAVVPNKKGAPNQGWAGLPARPGDKGIKVIAAQGLVPGLVETVRALRERVAELEKRGGGPAKRATK